MAAPPMMRMLAVIVPLASAKMSDFQVARFAEVQASAKAASAAAEPELLAVLDSGAFRAALAACCPAFAGESAASLLGTLVGEMGAAEICTGIPAGGGPDAPGSSWSTSMEDAELTEDLDDQWANRLRHNGSFAPSNASHSFSHWFAIQDDVEVGAYGLKPLAPVTKAAGCGPTCFAVDGTGACVCKTA
ncbi:hypothetical protein JL720_11143 [Aureococcus anophagefferens]|nr:hypothetical protein JL720_11143 [Aureococcus anophagefferens]